MEINFYTTFSSPFDTFSIIWQQKYPNLLIKRIFLSDPEKSSELKTFEFFRDIKPGSTELITSLGEKIQRFLKGNDESFYLELLDLKNCFESQKKVLLAEYEIPRGWISTYKRIAIEIGIPNGARVVGNALARNPFPIVIPCHRAVKSNGEIGGFQGGSKMKYALLKLEGIEISDRGRVITDRIYY